MDFFEIISKQNLEKAREIIAELKIEEIWQQQNSTCSLVGSVKTQLLMSHLDIDFHVYTNDFSVEKSFAAIAQISRNAKVKEVIYRNLLSAEDMCLEWHLLYEETPQRVWTIDIMHIKNESPYAGVIERVTEKICAAMTADFRQIILRLKWECEQQKEAVHGIEIYQAVMDDGVKNIGEFKRWKQGRKEVVISMWEPKVKTI
jgi:hypothetical protein